MRTILAVHLLAMACLLSNTAQAAQTATADLVNSSLKLNTGACDCQIGGLVWHMDFSSAYTEERAWANHELALSAQPAGYSHWSYLVLEDPSMWTSTSFMELNLPTEDINGNGTPDFFEVGMPVTTGSVGIYQIDWGPCPLTVTWSRAAGATAGSYQLTLNDKMLGNLGPFRGSFEVVQARGSLSYTPGGSEISGELSFPATSVSPQLRGSVKFVKSAGEPFDKLTLQAGALTNESDNLEFPLCPLTRRDSVYSGLFVLATAYFTSWTLLITDRNDSDNDGIPDLSDAALLPPSRPALSLKSSQGGLQLLIPGNTGRTCHLEETPSLSQPSWGVVKTFSLTSDPHVLDLPLGNCTTPRFWRVRLE